MILVEYRTSFFAGYVAPVVIFRLLCEPLSKSNRKKGVEESKKITTSCHTISFCHLGTKRFFKRLISSSVPMDIFQRLYPSTFKLFFTRLLFYKCATVSNGRTNVQIVTLLIFKSHHHVNKPTVYNFSKFYFSPFQFSHLLR